LRLAVERLFSGLLFLQLDVQWLPIMIARYVSQWLSYLEISAIAKDGFPRLWDSDTLNERFAAMQSLFARAGSERSG